MRERIGNLLEEIGRELHALPDVFSTTQWGGRAYKLPRPDGSRSKPKLLAFVVVPKEGDAVSVGFKLPPDRARAVVDRYSWIAPDSFRTLAPAGWIRAQITNRRQVATLRKLMAESRALHTVQSNSPESAQSKPDRLRTKTTSAAARRIDQVMADARVLGWSPRGDGDFTD